MLKSVLQIAGKVWFLFRLWSLDVVAGSMAVGAFFCKILDVRMPLWWWFVLASSVWIMYTVDHLFDGYRIKDTASTAIFRHYYHATRKTPLLLLVLITSVLTLFLVIRYAPPVLLKRGLALLAIIGLYFLLVNFVRHSKFFLFQKELAIAVIYAAGIAIGPLTFSAGKPETWQVILIVGMILMAWAEGIMASWFDHDNDLHDGHTSFATVFGLQNTKYFLIALQHYKPYEH